ncbi:sulfur carrier protein ThiS [Marinobacterium arenosum]|uniref:sulfur carrier protein ThiS n=1 Tax=Marinobacterium arenosum TaxID=2862496 RepID=UPI001C96EF57|nr:sulfur carrier protein ThiS [Marinobacterium arenosum]MBY4678627.1 sulfur carrier protein ThiS [Marinobacterium arenosum]
MQIQVNGDSIEVRDGATLSELLDQLGLAGKRVAIELNLEIIPRSEHGQTALRTDDQVEIVHAIGGG